MTDEAALGTARASAKPALKGDSAFTEAVMVSHAVAPSRTRTDQQAYRTSPALNALDPLCYPAFGCAVRPVRLATPDLPLCGVIDYANPHRL